MAAEEEAELQEVEIVDDPDPPTEPAAPPPRRLTKPPLPASAEARETIRVQEEVIASLTGELTEARGDLELRSMDLAQAQMEHATEKRARAADVANLERLLADREATQRVDLEELATAHALAEASAAERLTLQQRVDELEATLASEHDALTESVRGHSRALSAAKTHHDEHEHALAAERAAHTSTRALLDSMEGELASQQLERKAAEGHAQQARTEHEATLARLRAELTRVEALEKELASTKGALVDAGRAIERSQQDAIKEELARDAASHDANVRAMQAQEEAVRKAREQAEKEREELVRAHERSIVTMRDEAVAKALQVLKARRKSP